MKSLAIFTFCLFSPYVTNAQRDSIIVNGTVLEIMRDPFGYLKFNPRTSDVTAGWIGYLDEIGQYYSKDLLVENRHYIELVPTLTKSENELSNRLILERVEFIASYLNAVYKISRRHIVGRNAVHNSDIASVQVMILQKNISQLTRKQRKQVAEESAQENFVEDQYFKE